MSTTKLSAIKAARYKAAKLFPYFSDWFWALQFVEVEDMIAKGFGGPIGVDRWGRCYYDPNHINKWNIEELAGALVHETNHLNRGHHERAEKIVRALLLDPESAKAAINISEDAEINDDYRDITMPKDPPPIYPEKIGAMIGKKLKDGEFFETYFRAILEKFPPQSACSGEGNSEESSKDQGNQKKKKSNGNMPQNNCGSCAHGVKEPWELDKNDPEHPALHNAEKEIIRRRTAEKIVDQQNRQPGTIPAGLLRWAQEKLTIKFDPRKELQSAIKNAVIEIAGQVDFSWRRRSHRHNTYERMGIYLPGMKAPVPNICVTIDTSGSMTDKDLAYALALVDKVLKSLGQREGVKVLCVDAALHTTKKVFSARQIELAGGGGTDMRIGLAAAEEQKPKPDIIILITDGGTPWPAKALKTKTIIALVGNYCTEEQCPKWAKTIKIDNEESQN